MLLRERILVATADELCDSGWRALTVAAVARRAGVRRQGVYEEIGPKADLGRALVEREARGHLAEVCRRIERAPSPSVALVRAAEHVLRDISRDRLVLAVLGVGGVGPDPELVTVVTADAAPVLAPALAAVTAAVSEAFPTVPGDRARTACAVVVRLTLSHLLQPLGRVEDALAEVRAVAEALVPSSA